MSIPTIDVMRGIISFEDVRMLLAIARAHQAQAINEEWDDNDDTLRLANLAEKAGQALWHFYFPYENKWVRPEHPPYNDLGVGYSIDAHLAAGGSEPD